MLFLGKLIQRNYIVHQKQAKNALHIFLFPWILGNLTFLILTPLLTFAFPCIHGFMAKLLYKASFGSPVSICKQTYFRLLISIVDLIMAVPMSFASCTIGTLCLITLTFIHGSVSSLR